MQNSASVTKNKISANRLVKVSILSVVSYIIMLLDFPLPMFPSFLRIDLSDVPALVGSFALGPIAGVFIQFVKVVLYGITRSSTFGVGELANFIIGVSYVVPAALVYRYKKDKFHALIGVIVGTVVMCVVGAVANYYVLIPFYSNFMPIESIIELGTVVNSKIVDVKTLVLYGITPFNLVKGMAIGTATLLIYKRLSPIIKK
jgi:riboflavin transporter FmnP